MEKGWRITRWSSIFFLIVLSPILAAAVPLTIHDAAPSFARMCGDSAQEQVFTATLRNSGNTTHENVIAHLNIPAPSGLFLQTSNPLIFNTLSPTESVSPAWTVACGEAIFGNYSLSINLSSTDNTNSINTLLPVFSIEVEVPLRIINYLPSRFAKESFLNITTNKPATCKFDTVDKPFTEMAQVFSVTGNKQHTNYLTLADGTYIYYVRCQDAQHTTPPQRLDFTLDTAKPEIVDYMPKGMVHSKFVSLNITTTEESTCVYNDQETTRKTFANIKKTTHLLDLVLSRGENIFLVTCSDNAGNTGADQELFLFFAEEPTAKIEVSPSSPLPAGSIVVTITTSIELREAPLLFYKLENGEKQQIFLAGKGRQWDGIFILENSSTQQVGIFSFEGITEFGVQGTTITEGAVFIIDPVPPSAPSNLKIKQEGINSIFLSWDPPEKLIDHYVVYRSEQPEVPTDTSFGTTQKTWFLDPHGAEKQYYYRVIAIDAAGNKGSPSPALSLYALPPPPPSLPQEQPSSSPEQNTELIHEENPPQRLELAQQERKEELQNIKQTISNIRTAIRDKYADEVNLLNLVQQWREAEAKIVRLQEQVNRLSSNISINEFEKEIGFIDKNISALKKSIPRDLTVVEEKKIVEDVSEEEIRKILFDIFTVENYAAAEKASETLASMYKNANIETSLKIVDLKYYDNQNQLFTLVQRKMSKALREGSVVEYIPTSVALDTSDIEFKKGTLLNNSPAFVTDASKEWGYFIKKRVPLENARELKTLLIPDMKELSQELIQLPQSYLGSFLSVLRLPAQPTFFGIIIILFLLSSGAYFFFFYNIPIALPVTTFFSSLFAKIPSSRFKKTPPSTKDIKEELEQAHQAINNLDFEKAHKTYVKLHTVAEHQQLLSSLYYKLKLWVLLQELKEAFDNKNLSAIKEKEKNFNALLQQCSPQENTQLIKELSFYKNLLKK